MRKEPFAPMGTASEFPGPLLEAILSVPHSQPSLSGYPFSVFQLRGILAPEGTWIEKSIPRSDHFLVDQPIIHEDISQETMILVPFIPVLHFQSDGFAPDPGEGKFPGFFPPGFLPHLRAPGYLWSINFSQTDLLFSILNANQDGVPVEDLDNPTLEGLPFNPRREDQRKKKKSEENPIVIPHGEPKTKCPRLLVPLLYAFSKSLFSFGYLPVRLHFNLVKEFIVLSLVHDIFGLPSRSRFLLNDYGKSNLSLIPVDLFYRGFDLGSIIPLHKVIRFHLSFLPINLRAFKAPLFEDTGGGFDNNLFIEVEGPGVLRFRGQSVF